MELRNVGADEHQLKPGVQLAEGLRVHVVPAILLEGLTEAKKRALLLADNKIAENAVWDRKGLALEFPQLSELLIGEGLEISIPGFAPVEIDQLSTDWPVGTRNQGPGKLYAPAW